MRMPSVVLVLSVLAAAGGCGDSPDSPDPTPTPEPGITDPQRGILGTVDALQSAARAGDGARICEELFTAGLARAVAAGAGRSCAAEVRGRLFSRDTQLSVQRDIAVDGDRATATIRDSAGDVSTLAMRRVDGRWRIDRVTPAGSR